MTGAVFSLAAPGNCTVCYILVYRCYSLVTWLKALGTSRKKKLVQWLDHLAATSLVSFLDAMSLTSTVPFEGSAKDMDASVDTVGWAGSWASGRG